MPSPDLLGHGYDRCVYFLGQRHLKRATAEPFESGIVSVGYGRFRLPVQFYLLAMFFVIFDLEAAFLYAWATAVRAAGWTGYIVMLVFIITLLAALAYLWRTGALDGVHGPAAPEAKSRLTSCGSR